jgi:[ribosomal protein S18]-alanine N-acetyltransferase
MIGLEPIPRAAGAAMAVLLSQLHSSCFPDDPWPPQAMAEIVAMIGLFGQIAFDNEEATGLALAQGVGKECEILTLGVVPARRRAGIGSALLTAIVGECRSRGARILFLEVAEDNIPARALYAAHGFVQISRRVNYYRRPSGHADALVLRLLLST